MNKHTFLGALLCLAASSVFAQVEQFSYVSDRRFSSPDQLMGYDFKPAMREVPGEEPTELKVGSYSFGITRNNLYVEGANIRGVYNLNEINSTEYGYILRTMNARDPTIQGHLKVVVDEIGQVEGLIFKRSNSEKEVIYFLRVIPDDVAAAELEYFTNKGALEVPQIDSLWASVEVRPFLRIFNNMGGIQQRILPSDSVSLRFYHVTTIEEKDNKLAALAKGGKRKKGDADAPADGIDESSITASTAPMTVAKASTQVLANLQIDQVKAPTPASSLPAKPTTTPMNSGAAPTQVLAEAADSTSLSLSAKPLVTTAPDSSLPISIRETSSGLAMIGPDSAAMASLDSLGLGDQLLANAALMAVDSSNVKLKITTQFFVDLNSFMRYDDGTSEMQHRTYLVNGALERVNPASRPGGDRYQWELNLHKQPTAFVYLDENHKVNSVEIDGQKFYMRGQ